MTEKNIKNYLHLHLGCEIFKPGTKLISVNIEDDEYTILEDDGFNSRVLSLTNTNPKPFLRPLSDITEEELTDVANTLYTLPVEKIKELVVERRIDLIHTTPDVFLYLLSKGFDLFGLIESGLAIDKTKI